MPVVDDDFRRRLAELSDEDFEQRFGAFRRLEPGDAASVLDGFAAPWWIVGGWAIEAFTGVGRPHEDLDVCILRRDVPALVEHFLESHHVWATGGGMMCPVLTPTQELPSWAGQLWVRESATSPWLLDFIVTPDQDGRWVFRRDPNVVDDLDNVTWLAADGIRYQNPEITLAFKAHFARPKDTADLDATLPKLGERAALWLAETVDRLHPDHEWLGRLRA